ncbi:MAG: DUF4337 family protein [Proteobacteria bacterium]|nr:DUF4337 family protein [Pseudomonadota bacterium]
MAEQEESESDRRFNNLIAISIAFVATFMALSAIKSSNLDKSIAQTQAERIDNWAWYQAVRVREDMATYELASLQRLERNAPSPAERARLATEITAQNGEITHIRQRKDEVQTLARRSETDLSAMQPVGDQYDLSDALLSIATALLAICALARVRWLFWFSLIPAAAGLIVGACAMARIVISLGPLSAWLG